MDKAYEPGLHDKKWQQFWEDQKIYRPEVSIKAHPKPTGKTYTIVMPPPNVTGVLHQGHALMLALEDTLVRWRRMCGDETLYIPGSDHASIAVNMLVARELEKQGKDYRSMGREAFVQEAWKWIREYQPRIYGQFRALGTSCDWSRVAFTMDDGPCRAVEESFMEFHRRGLVYRAERLVNWSPKGQTGLSDLEVVYEEREGSLWHIRYPLADDPTKHLVVATTRPETLLGDTAVAVHPDDERYKALVGKDVLLPIVGRRIPVIADTFVDKEFGSGAVKITPAHDPNDFECGKRHNLPFLNILTKDGAVVNGLPGEGAKLGGLDRFKARDEIVKMLEAKGQLERVQKHTHRVGLSERWKDVVEPYLSMQWYLKMDGMAKKALHAVQSGEVKIIPHEFHNQFVRWMENTHDWCISRQLWWGHRVPAYHCDQCKHVEVSTKDFISCPKCGHKGMHPDPDVLDTWYSSGLWPFSTLGWPDKDAADFKKFFPTQVMETGFDILFFWVARMMMMSLELTGKVPFKQVCLHPMVRDAQGQKMSKTKGNVIDPLEIVNDVGADSLRFTLNALCVQGRDLNLSEERIEKSRNFINKIWNATKFALMGPAVGDWRNRPSPKHLHDRWILMRLDEISRDLNKSWGEFRMQEAADSIFHFVWNDYCDWYLECAKNTRDDSQAVVLHVLGEALKMLHPLIPHVTEELWHALPGVAPQSSLAVEVFPQGEIFPDAEAIAEFRFLQDFVTSLRNLRADAQVKPSKTIKIFVPRAGSQSRRVLEKNATVVAYLAKVEKIEFGAAPSETTTKILVTAVEAGENIEALIPVSELRDLGEERERLKKETENLEKLVKAQESKLSNESFVSRAPPEVVGKERLKLQELQDKLVKTAEAMKALS